MAKKTALMGQMNATAWAKMEPLLFIVARVVAFVLNEIAFVMGSWIAEITSRLKMQQPIKGE